MKIYDISLPLSERLPVWPGDPRVDVREVRSMAAGAHSNASQLTCNVHSGTHVDAPSHFIPDGRPVDQTPLEVLVGPATVCGLPDVDQSSAADLAALHLSSGIQRLLIRLACLPLKLTGADGAPARAVLYDMETR